MSSIMKQDNKKSQLFPHAIFFCSEYSVCDEDFSLVDFSSGAVPLKDFWTPQPPSKVCETICPEVCKTMQVF